MHTVWISHMDPDFAAVYLDHRQELLEPYFGRGLYQVAGIVQIRLLGVGMEREMANGNNAQLWEQSEFARSRGRFESGSQYS